MPNRVKFPNNQKIANIGPRTNPGTAKKSYGSGKETLRLRANGPARVEEAVSIPYFVGIFFYSLAYTWNDKRMMSRCLYKGKRENIGL